MPMHEKDVLVPRIDFQPQGLTGHEEVAVVYSLNRVQLL